MGSTRLPSFLPGRENSGLRRRILRDERDVILIPIPQYPLYS